MRVGSKLFAIMAVPLIAMNATIPGESHAAVRTVFVNGVLLVMGDTSFDRIVVACGAGGNVLVNGSQPVPAVACVAISFLFVVGGTGLEGARNEIEVIESSTASFPNLRYGPLAIGGETIKGATLAVGRNIVGSSLRPGDNVLIGTIGDDTIELSPDASGVIIGGHGSDDLTGSNGRDVLITNTDGSVDRATFRGRGGNDILIQLSTFNHTLMKGAAGDDVLVGGPGLLRGGGGDDVLIGDSDGAELIGGDGEDTLIGGPGECTEEP